MPQFQFAIYDLDMTLIDSIVPLMTSANMLAKEFGLREVSYEEVYKAEVGVPNCTLESLWTDLWGRYDQAWYEAYFDHLTEVEYQAMQLYPTGLETLETIAALGIPQAMASNRVAPMRALQCIGIDHFFQVVVGVGDVDYKSKPAPDVIIKALEMLKARPDEALYICDSMGDLAAARDAGVRTFSVTTGGHTAEELKTAGAWRTGERIVEAVEYFR